MGDLSAGFGTGFEIGSIIKEKRKAKKILEQVQNTIQEWKLSGEEPSYVDKVLMSVLLNQAGTSYAASFADIENNKNTMDREKLSQDGMNLRTLNDNGMALLKMIETSAKEGTLGLIDWFQVPKEMFPPDFDLNKFLSKDTITKLQNDDTRQAALDEVMGITRALPEEYRKGHMEREGVLEPGLEPTPKEPTALSAKDNWAIENYKTGKINFDQLSKYMGAYIEPEKATELQKKIAEAKNYGATNEEIKKMIVGGTGGGGIEGETVTTLKNWEKMFDIKDEEGPKTEEEYNRALDLLAQSKDKYKPKFATWKEALVAEAKGIAKELEGTTDKEDYNLLLNVYMQKLEEIKAKYPEVDLNQFPEFKENKSWFDKLKEKVGL